jgi:hypothetical protein
MSSWLAVDDDPDEDGDERFLIHERLVRDDGLVLGAIMRFYDCGPTYAWSQHGRIGACSPAGERALEASTSSGETGGGELPG